MRYSSIIAVLLLLLVAGSAFAQAQPDEDDLVSQYIVGTERAHAKRVGWISGSFTYNRINRANDYNRFTNYESRYLQDGTLDWLGDGSILGFNLGTMFKDRFAWSLGGEYWLELGQSLEGNYIYDPPLSAATVLTNPSSTINVMGLYTELSYYVINPPHKVDQLTGLALKVGGSVGYYFASWELWNQLENLNLSSALPDGENITFKGTAPAFTVKVGAEYPVGIMGLVMGISGDYMYLNFKNVAWYNSQDEEVVVTHSGDPTGRVDLQLSGVRANVELKRFFSW
jgi:hypothetical protein